MARSSADATASFGCSGAGGMGAVYEAVQEGLGRKVALKVHRLDCCHTGPSQQVANLPPGEDVRVNHVPA